MPDWTSKDGNANSSDAYLAICDRVSQLITNSAATLMTGGVNIVARLIVAQLAHTYGMTPKEAEPSESPIVLELVERIKLLREALESIGNGMPGASIDELRLAAQDALLKLSDRESWA